MSIQTTKETFLTFTAVFYEVADESGLVYNPSTQKANFYLEKDETKAKFLVQLIENYGFKEEDLRVDFEPLSLDVLGSIDLVAFKNDFPFLACKILRNNPTFAEMSSAREVLFNQMKDIRAEFGVLVFGVKTLFFQKKAKKIIETCQIFHYERLNDNR